MRCVIWAAAVSALAGAGCSKKSQDGLPPASEWQTAQGSAPAAPEAPEPDEPIPHFTPPPGMTPKETNPHAGLDMSDPNNPHAGLDMDGDGEPDSPGGGTDVTKLGLPAPDPDRPIDPTHRVAGTITVDPKAKAKLTPGTSVFLTVKRAGPDGAPSGSPLAVEKLSWTGDGMAFELTEANAMTAGTDLSGDVVVMAHYDQDSDALSRQPGDLTGQVRVKIPAEHVKLTLDTVLP